ncbi:MAG TPA: hypothetical protein VG324_21820, partial [Blastocatellia bacterium]|nr:hypothetical protein [Blastocatellia bacterium]
MPNEECEYVRYGTLIACKYNQRIYFIADNQGSEEWFMKTAIENISIFTSHGLLRRLMAEYESFDAARRLCADYCITAGDVTRLIDGSPKPKRSKSRLAFV